MNKWLLLLCAVLLTIAIWTNGGRRHVEIVSNSEDIPMPIARNALGQPSLTFSDEGDTGWIESGGGIDDPDTTSPPIIFSDSSEVLK